LRRCVERLGEGGVLGFAARGGEQFRAKTGQDAISPASSVASQRGRMAGSRGRTHADVSTTSGIVAKGSAKVGFALGVDLARLPEVVVGLASGDAQQVIGGRASALALVAFGFGAADGEIADQA
jgi:hypothetical protein